MRIGAYPAQNISTADDVLREADDIMNELGISHFLWHGTCLCFYRDGEYCETDPDIDIGILSTKEEREELFRVMDERGYHRENVLFSGNCHFFKNEMEVDVYYRFNPKHTEFLQEFDTVNYKGRMFHIPHPIEGYLQMEYGNKWPEKQSWTWQNGWHK